MSRIPDDVTENGITWDRFVLWVSAEEVTISRLSTFTKNKNKSKT